MSKSTVVKKDVLHGSWEQSHQGNLKIPNKYGLPYGKYLVIKQHIVVMKPEYTTQLAMNIFSQNNVAKYLLRDN